MSDILFGLDAVYSKIRLPVKILMRLVFDCLISKHQIYSNMIFLPSICSFTLHIFTIGYHKITSFNWSDCSPCMAGWAGLHCNVANFQMWTFSKDLFYQPDLLGPSKLEGKKVHFRFGSFSF